MIKSLKNVSHNILIFVLLLIILFLVFRYSETFNRGYNISEDQQIISLCQEMSKRSVYKVFINFVKNDFTERHRFRPFFDFHVVLATKIFKDNFLAYNIYLWLLGTFTGFFIYLFSKNIGFSLIYSFLFVLLTLTGPVSIIWTEITYAENLGMFMIAISLYFLSKSIYSERNELIYKICFLISLFLAALSKESFLLLIPAVVFLYLWVNMKKDNTGIIKAIRENKFILISAVLFFAFELFLILIYIGTNEQGYTGVNSSIISLKTIVDFVSTIFDFKIIYITLFGLVIVLINNLRDRQSDPTAKKQFIDLLLVSIFTLMVIVPQLVLYYKTDFYEPRYFLPYLFGFSFLILYLLKIIDKSKSISSAVKYFYIIVISIFILFEIKTGSIPVLSTLSKNCIATTQLVNKIITEPDKELLIVMDPVQNYFETYSLKTYLNYLKGQNDYKYDFIKRDFMYKIYSDTAFYNRILESSQKDLGNVLIESGNDNSDIKKILIFQSLGNKFIEKNSKWFNEKNFEKDQFGSYVFYH